MFVALILELRLQHSLDCNMVKFQVIARTEDSVQLNIQFRTYCGCMSASMLKLKLIGWLDMLGDIYHIKCLAIKYMGVVIEYFL